jgi:hypothetical protein
MVLIRIQKKKEEAKKWRKSFSIRREIEEWELLLGPPETEQKAKSEMRRWKVIIFVLIGLPAYASHRKSVWRWAFHLKSRLNADGNRLIDLASATNSKPFNYHPPGGDLLFVRLHACCMVKTSKSNSWQKQTSKALLTSATSGEQHQKKFAKARKSKQ